MVGRAVVTTGTILFQGVKYRPEVTGFVTNSFNSCRRIMNILFFISPFNIKELLLWHNHKLVTPLSMLSVKAAQRPSMFPLTELPDNIMEPTWESTCITFSLTLTKNSFCQCNLHGLFTESAFSVLLWYTT